MKLSMMSYTMSRQPDFSVEAMFDLTRELALDGIDLVTLHGRQASELRRMADDIGVPVVCHTFPAVGLASLDGEERAAATDATKAGLEAAHILGAPTVMIPTPGAAGVEREERRRRWIDGLAAVAPLADDAGITLSIENFPGANSPFVTAADLQEALDAVPGLKVTFDNGNAGTGEDPATSFTACAAHVVHAHFKDWAIVDAPQDGYRQMLDGRYYRPALIGEGDLSQAGHHAACLQAMAAAGYDGCINIEYEENKPAAEAMRSATAYLRGLSP